MFFSCYPSKFPSQRKIEQTGQKAPLLSQLIKFPQMRLCRRSELHYVIYKSLWATPPPAAPRRLFTCLLFALPHSCQQPRFSLYENRIVLKHEFINQKTNIISLHCRVTVYLNTFFLKWVKIVTKKQNYFPQKTVKKLQRCKFYFWVLEICLSF